MPGESRPNRYRRAHRNCIEKFANVAILQRHAAPRPITACAVAVNVDVAAELRVLWRSFMGIQSLDDRVVLRPGDQTVSQSSPGMGGVGITDTQGKIEGAPVVPGEDIEVALRRAPVALPNLVA